MTFLKLLLHVIILSANYLILCQASNGKTQIERTDDIDRLKKILRTKKNVLILYKYSPADDNCKKVMGLFDSIADSIYGKSTLAIVDCQSDSGRKTCKKMKATGPKPYLLYHYNNGVFNKEYDRSLTEASLRRFLADPTSDMPWEEQEDAQDILHVPDAKAWRKILNNHGLPILAMFYAPWCGYCKRLKPEFSAAASSVKSKAILAALDVTRSELYELQSIYNISGFPTLLYFEEGKLKLPFSGQQTKDGIVSWLQNPTPAASNAGVVEEKSWSEEESDVVHLTDETFPAITSAHKSVLVMFYAPWCGHCKTMKPAYVEAAKTLKDQKVDGILAAVDATKEKTTAEKYQISGFPSVKFFQSGVFMWDFKERTKDAIVSFMKDPKQPPPSQSSETSWTDDDSQKDVVQLTTENFKVELKKRKHALVMFYAPWCGHCKQAKPEFGLAASHFKDDFKVIFATVDCSATENLAVCKGQNVQGFPTIKYFHYFKESEVYFGGRLASDFIGYIEAQSGSLATEPPQTSEPSAGTLPGEEAFPEITTPVEGEDDAAADLESWGDVVELTEDNYERVMNAYERILVMFHSPTCRFCLEDKPEFKAAATRVKKRTDVALAEMDCSKFNSRCWEFRVAGYPSMFLFDKTKYVDIHRGYPNRENLVRTVLQHLIKKQQQPQEEGVDSESQPPASSKFDKNEL